MRDEYIYDFGIGGGVGDGRVRGGGNGGGGVAAFVVEADISVVVAFWIFSVFDADIGLGRGVDDKKVGGGVRSLDSIWIAGRYWGQDDIRILTDRDIQGKKRSHARLVAGDFINRHEYRRAGGGFYTVNAGRKGAAALCDYRSGGGSDDLYGIVSGSAVGEAFRAGDGISGGVGADRHRAKDSY